MINTGVYQIRNLINNKVYIGSTSGKYGFRKRWNSHRSALNNQHHHSLHLQNAWSKYGTNAFVFEILERCDPSMCLEQEQHHLDTVHSEYNIALRAHAPMTGRKHSEKTKDKIRKAQEGKIFSKEHRAKIGKANQKRRGENHPRVKLTRSNIYKIRELLRQGVIQDTIAKQFRVSPITISRIKTGYNWSHVL